MSADNLPKFHHYLPSFYQARWAGEDGRLRRFSKPYQKVVAKWVYPSQSGGEHQLYSDPKATPALAQRVERHFMSPLDSLASQALTMIETGDATINQSSKFRSAWSRFLMSLMMRMPNDLDTLKSGLMAEWAKATPDLERTYAANKEEDWPLTFQDYLDSQDPLMFESWSVSLLPKLIDHTLIGELLNDMRWFTREIEGDATFLTSDRPLITWYEFTRHDSYIFLPIGPKRLFAAVNNIETQRRIESRPPKEWIESQNRLVVGAARQFVFAADDKQRGVVEEHFGNRPRATLFDYLLRYRRQANLAQM